MTIRLRRHHILCCLGYEGAGDDSAFVANMSQIAFGQLRGNGGAEMEILISRDADVLCAACPFRRGLGCESQALVDTLDARHGAALDVRPGDRLTWGECVRRVRTRIRPRDLTSLCEGCSWLANGTCQAAVARVRAETTKPPVGGPVASP